jgi:uncharacterized protein YjbI with pentapeptide repeats|tara:strand:- start:2371 stop:2586 length:216 start_codon:yes stop_codon:yes gene_type:complete
MVGGTFRCVVGATLTGANLSGADLTGTNLRGANLTGANLTGANLTAVKWSNTTCPDGTVTDTGWLTVSHLD